MAIVPAITFGFPKIHAEPGEKRAFPPSLIARLVKRGAHILLEEGYGATLGYSEVAYLSVGNGNVRFVERQEVYRQDYVVVLRCPSDELLKQLKPGACLIAMLHFPTRPERVKLLRDRQVEAISLDSLKDDSGRRIVENLRAVGWNGMEVAFKVLGKLRPDFEDPGRGPIRVSLLGAGAVGVHVLQAASRYANVALRHRLFQANVPGTIVQALDYDITNHAAIMREILAQTDILVDATQRPDTSKPVIPNNWIAELPERAVMVDLSVDPYRCDHEPYSVKGIEGIPHGNLDQYIFAPDDPAFDLIPACVDTTHRRWSVSCYSWPGIYPMECMELYTRQIRPVLNCILDRGGVSNIDPAGRFFERAIGRALLSRWEPNEL